MPRVSTFPLFRTTAEKSWQMLPIILAFTIPQVLMKRVEELLSDHGHGKKVVSSQAKLAGTEGADARSVHHEWRFAVKKMSYKMSIGLVSTSAPLFSDWFHPLLFDKVCWERECCIFTLIVRGSESIGFVFYDRAIQSHCITSKFQRNCFSATEQFCVQTGMVLAMLRSCRFSQLIQTEQFFW